MNKKDDCKKKEENDISDEKNTGSWKYWIEVIVAATAIGAALWFGTRH